MKNMNMFFREKSSIPEPILDYLSKKENKVLTVMILEQDIQSQTKKHLKPIFYFACCAMVNSSAILKPARSLTIARNYRKC